MPKPKLPPPHLFQTADEDRRDQRVPRACIHCPLPETRTDIHTLRPVDDQTRAAEQRRYADKD